MGCIRELEIEKAIITTVVSLALTQDTQGQHLYRLMRGHSFNWEK